MVEGEGEGRDPGREGRGLRGARVCGGVVAALSLLACSIPRLVRSEGYCAPPSAAPVAIPSDPMPATATEPQRIAALLGLVSVLEEHPLTEASRTLAIERVELARLAMAATAAELACERERARQAADALSRTRSDQAQSLTIASIGAATATSIASVFLSTRGASDVAQDTVAIGGGAVTAGLGLASLYVHPTLPFHHARNLLADVWNGPAASELYPPLVWGYLSLPAFSNDHRVSIRQHLVDRWRREDGLLSDLPLARLLFEGGGVYDVDSLRIREELLGEVEAEVHLESQDLATLAIALFGRAGWAFGTSAPGELRAAQHVSGYAGAWSQPAPSRTRSSRSSR